MLRGPSKPSYLCGTGKAWNLFQPKTRHRIRPSEIHLSDSSALERTSGFTYRSLPACPIFAFGPSIHHPSYILTWPSQELLSASLVIISPSSCFSPLIISTVWNTLEILDRLKIFGCQSFQPFAISKTTMLSFLRLLALSTSCLLGSKLALAQAKSPIHLATHPNCSPQASFNKGINLSKIKVWWFYAKPIDSHLQLMPSLHCRFRKTIYAFGDSWSADGQNRGGPPPPPVQSGDKPDAGYVSLA